MSDSSDSPLPSLDLKYNFIGGEFVPPVAGQYLANYEPATGEQAGSIPDSDAEDVERAVAAAAAAFPAWSSLSAAERATMLRRIADGIEARADEFARAESRDQGKPVALAARIDVPRAQLNFRFFASAIEQHEEMAAHMGGPAGGVLTYTKSAAVGVAGLISPWNLPLYLLTWKVAPAIACGNTCVCKPSEFTSVTASLLCEVIRDVGVPPGVVNMVFGTGPRAGAPLVQHAKVPLISFTGGTATGKIIQRDCIEHMKKVSLELGGKNPNIIFDDADLDKCIERTKLSSFANQGEICLCGSRIYVQRGVYDEFVRRFVEVTKAIRVGDPRSPDSFMGALASAQHRDKVASYVKLAVEEGGKIECGGKAPVVEGFENGYFFEPTVITGLKNTCRVQQEEIFGPVVTISPFDTEAEAIELANDVTYGLSASVWTENVTRAHRVAHRLHTGTVWVNW